MKETILLLCGGQSGEHEISLLSARYIYSCLDQTRYDVAIVAIARDGSFRHIDEATLYQTTSFESHAHNDVCCLVPIGGKCQLRTPHQTLSIDLAFPVLHGVYGEDGAIQGYLDLLNIPYVGCGTESSANCMNKRTTKDLLKSQGVPVVPYVALTKHDRLPDFDKLCQHFGGQALFVKPSNQGSSLGISKATNARTFALALQEAFLYGADVLIEKAILGREIESAVLGNHHPQVALHLGEVCPSHDFYSYEAKYLDPNGAKIILPAMLSPDMTARVRTLALKAFSILHCRGLARVDFLVADNMIYLNEINTMPGFTPISLYPKLWEASGFSGKALVQKLLDLAQESYAEVKSYVIDAELYRKKASASPQELSLS